MTKRGNNKISKTNSRTRTNKKVASGKKRIRPAYIVLGIALVALAGIGVVLYSEASGFLCNTKGPEGSVCIGRYRPLPRSDSKSRFVYYTGNPVQVQKTGEWHWQNKGSFGSPTPIGVEVNNPDGVDLRVNIDRLSWYPRNDKNLYYFCFTGVDGVAKWNSTSTDAKKRMFTRQGGSLPRAYSSYNMKVYIDGKEAGSTGWETANNIKEGQYCVATSKWSSNFDRNKDVFVTLDVDGWVDITYLTMFNK